MDLAHLCTVCNYIFAKIDSMYLLLIIHSLISLFYFCNLCLSLDIWLLDYVFLLLLIIIDVLLSLQVVLLLLCLEALLALHPYIFISLVWDFYGRVA